MMVLMIYDLPLVEMILSKNVGWVRFGGYTAVVFVLLGKNLRTPQSSWHFWSVLAGLLLVHLVCFIWFIKNVRSPGAIHYIVCAPFELIALNFLLKSGLRYFDAEKEVENQ